MHKVGKKMGRSFVIWLLHLQIVKTDQKLHRWKWIWIEYEFLFYFAVVPGCCWTARTHSRQAPNRKILWSCKAIKVLLCTKSYFFAFAEWIIFIAYFHSVPLGVFQTESFFMIDAETDIWLLIDLNI